MKRLTLLRHAKSGWDDPNARDLDRPLNSKGCQAAYTVGRHLRELGLSFDRVVASPARRVRETVAAVTSGASLDLSPVWDERLYLAPASVIGEIIRETEDTVESLLVIGHNPGLEMFVLELVPDRADDLARDKVEEKYPTASLAELLVPIEHWADLGREAATLLRFTRPRDLDAALGPDARA